MLASVSAPFAVWVGLNTALSWVQQFVRLIGEGSIGRVHHGRWQETDVAIKTLNSLQHMQATTSAAEHEPDDEAILEDAAGDTDVLPIAAGSGFRTDQAAVLRSLEREVCPICRRHGGCQHHPSSRAVHAFVQSDPVLGMCSSSFCSS